MTERHARKLDRTVAFLRATMTRDSDHNPLEVWRPVAVVRAEVTPVSDGERVRAAEVAASISARVVTRWTRTLAGITPKDRAKLDGREFNIVNVKELGRRKWLEFSVQARAE